ncbi:hypothetical protein Leryth_006689 [Lithospermum erythrorhizon]|nr:hypothetical protein Leryth_006689 [Lithospermum erythrorhizon]
MIIKVAIICWCIKSKNRNELISTVRTEVQAFRTPPGPNQQANYASPRPELTQYAPTMELFLENLAKQKQVRFTAQQLFSFTNNYAKRLGSGGFGVVYKGQLSNGLKIAVKVLNRSSDRKAEEQFMAEVGTIGKTYHINLVKLYGFCFDNWMSALVYEYMENGSLDKYLFGNGEKLEFDQLHDIAIGTARGIAYLHEECEQRIIHYDIKPGNVLLDSKFAPKVADFGLAKLINRDDTHVTISGYRGTPGYSAPEFMLKNFPITHKCDVYSFGMLLFEIFGRRRNAIDANRGDATSSLDCSVQKFGISMIKMNWIK